MKTEFNHGVVLGIDLIIAFMKLQENLNAFIDANRRHPDLHMMLMDMDEIYNGIKRDTIRKLRKK